MVPACRVPFNRRQSNCLRTMKEKLFRTPLAFVELEWFDRLPKETSHRFAAHFVSNIVSVDIYHLAAVPLLRYCLAYSILQLFGGGYHSCYSLPLRPAKVHLSPFVKSRRLLCFWHAGKLLILCRRTILAARIDLVIAKFYSLSGDFVGLSTSKATCRAIPVAIPSSPKLQSTMTVNLSSGNRCKLAEKPDVEPL